MTWLGDIWASFRGGTAPSDRVLVRNLIIPKDSDIGQEIVEDECYLELYVESFRPEKARSFATTFNGVIYSSITMARTGEPNQQLTAVSKPEFLSTLDSNTVDVITLSRRMMGPIAWRGGTLHLELGLFSVKTGNVLTPVIDLVTEISTTAGISFVGTAKPFIPLLTKGLDLIAMQKKETAIEVAVDSDLVLAKTEAFAIIDAQKGTIDVSKISVDENDRKLWLDGKPLQMGYCVFSVKKTDSKPDFGAIPELNAKYEEFRRNIAGGKKKEAEDALTAFRLATLASPDLITKDAARLAGKAKAIFDAAFPAGLVIKNAVAKQVPELSEINLYD